MTRRIAMAASVGLFLFALCAAFVAGQEVEAPVLKHIRAVSVSVEVDGRSCGSGTLIEKDGETFCVTAEHVTRGGKRFRVTQPNKSKLSVVAEFVNDDKGKDVAILSLGRGVFKDHALLCSCEKCAKKCDCNPCLCGNKKLPLDTPLVHCGSMAGLHQTITRGYLVQHDQDAGGKICDVADMTGWFGSSGGGVFDTNGVLVGMTVAGHGQRLSFFVPIRTINQVLHPKTDAKADEKGCCDGGCCKNPQKP